MVLEGDFTAQYVRWDQRCIGQKEATYWEKHIDKYGLVNGTDDLPTHYGMWN